MKKFSVFLCILALILGGSGVAQAVPMYYTFEGTVTGVVNPDAIFDAQGLSIGSAVTYTFAIDLDAPGTNTTIGGTTSFIGTYYADYVGGSALAEPDNPFYTGTSFIGEHNHVYTSATNHAYWIKTQSLNNYLAITATGYPGIPIGWDSSTAVSAYNRYWHIDDVGRSVFSALNSADLQLTDISDTLGAPVPEPATMLLFGIGLLGLAGVGRKKLCKKE